MSRALRCFGQETVIRAFFRHRRRFTSGALSVLLLLCASFILPRTARGAEEKVPLVPDVLDEAAVIQAEPIQLAENVSGDSDKEIPAEVDDDDIYAPEKPAGIIGFGQEKEFVPLWWEIATMGCCVTRWALAVIAVVAL